MRVRSVTSTRVEKGWVKRGEKKLEELRRPVTFVIEFSRLAVPLAFSSLYPLSSTNSLFRFPSSDFNPFLPLFLFFNFASFTSPLWRIVSRREPTSHVAVDKPTSYLDDVALSQVISPKRELLGDRARGRLTENRCPRKLFSGLCVPSVHLAEVTRCFPSIYDVTYTRGLQFFLLAIASFPGDNSSWTRIQICARDAAQSSYDVLWDTRYLDVCKRSWTAEFACATDYENLETVYFKSHSYNL